MDDNLQKITNALNLRPPQAESLKLLQLTEILTLKKNPDLQAELSKVRKFFPDVKDFEHEFPSVCFSLATGIGKTRLMGACIAYLHYEHKIKNFFVMAPNLTIYEKLKADFGAPETEKYVFRGLDKFTQAPRIIDGENYREYSESSLFSDDEIIINVFNISKLNSDSKSADGKPARIKRLNEVLGESYFDYLKSLKDLCIFMDESHHYRADKSMSVINELQPILGVEVTATPQIQRNTKKILFRNIIYQYTLASALQDKNFVKVPAVATRKNFDPRQFDPDQLDREKLIDGIRAHIETKSQLEIYSRRTGKKLIKPFILVVAKDTAHSQRLKDLICSKDFFGKQYDGKVIEINSSLRGAEKDSNIEKLLSLEKPDNQIEIVIHVNMLKEGWDVANLYTIVPLRASVSETLTEQTIGRGLRLPYGERTGVEAIDRLTIISHDRYQEIIDTAKNPNSIVQKICYIDEIGADENCRPKEIVENKSVYETETKSEKAIEQIAANVPAEVAKFIAESASNAVVNLNRRVETFAEVEESAAKNFAKSAVVEETLRKFPATDKNNIETAASQSVEFCVQNLTENIIPIPRVTIQPVKNRRIEFRDFDLDTANFTKLKPSSNTLEITNLAGGFETETVEIHVPAYQDTGDIVLELVRRVADFDSVDYRICGDLIFKLVAQAKKFFEAYQSAEDAEKVLRENRRAVAAEIFKQMSAHFYLEKIQHRATKILPFTKIEPNFVSKVSADKIYTLADNVKKFEVPRKIFTGFKKSCHKLCKFDSNLELTFASILEKDGGVLRWLRPAEKQFDIYYSGASKYEPDFVVETADKIFMVETKMAAMVENADVKLKAGAAKVFCAAVTPKSFKPWEYALLPETEILSNFSFEYLISRRKEFLC